MLSRDTTCLISESGVRMRAGTEMRRGVCRDSYRNQRELRGRLWIVLFTYCQELQVPPRSTDASEEEDHT